MSQPRRRTHDEDELQRLAREHIKPLGDAKLLSCWVDSPYTFAVTFSHKGKTYTQFVRSPYVLGEYHDPA